MRRTPGAACLLILLILLAVSSLNGQTQPRMWVTGYYPVWAVTDMPARDVNWSGMTHVVHFPQSSLQTVAPYWSPCVRNAQGLQDSLDLARGGGWVYPHNSQDIPDSLRRYARNAGAKVLLSVGGIYGSGAAALDYITQDCARCYVFVESAVRFAQRHRYDGIEIDWVTLASWWERDLLSDLYYADIYNSSGDFCSWDANGNNLFGEIDHDGNDLDGVDLYADVHIGRLPCSDKKEVITIVNKIMTYEEETYHQIWFKEFLLAGGDTFPPYLGASPSVYEGEITNTEVAQHLPGFDTTFLWASTNSLQPMSFNRAINKGVGFVSYSGHGFEHGWGTYRPNSETERGMIWYFTPYIIGLNNENKLPIIFPTLVTCRVPAT